MAANAFSILRDKDVPFRKRARFERSLILARTGGPRPVELFARKRTGERICGTDHSGSLWSSPVVDAMIRVRPACDETIVAQSDATLARERAVRRTCALCR
jgi:hypothetical protein